MVVLKRTRKTTVVRVAPRKGYTVTKPARYQHHKRERPENYRGTDY
ncbi:MAG: hypothetical protein M0Q91_12770 [Methanoregula sp.]|nr:hypothetical protein [Methanoregula sp.]